MMSFTRIYSMREMKAAMETMAMTDNLTELPNRRAIFRQIEGRMADGGEFTLAYLDLDNFKMINDTYGHETGDLVLMEASKRIRDCVGEGGSVSRIGGDEFVVLMENTRPGQANEVAKRVAEALEKPVYRGDGQKIPLSASIGTAVFPRDGKDISTLLAHADECMYRAKHHRPSRHISCI